MRDTRKWRKTSTNRATKIHINTLCRKKKKQNPAVNLLMHWFLFINIVWYYLRKKIPSICFLPDCRNIFCSLTIQGLCSLLKFIKLILNLLGLILVPQVLSHSLQPNSNSLGANLYPELLRETKDISVNQSANPTPVVNVLPCMVRVQQKLHFPYSSRQNWISYSEELWKPLHQGGCRNTSPSMRKTGQLDELSYKFLLKCNIPI